MVKVFFKGMINASTTNHNAVKYASGKTRQLDVIGQQAVQGFRPVTDLCVEFRIKKKICNTIIFCKTTLQKIFSCIDTLQSQI